MPPDPASSIRAFGTHYAPTLPKKPGSTPDVESNTPRNERGSNSQL